MLTKKYLNSNLFSVGGTGLADKAILAKNLAVMQKAGLTIVDSLNILEESARGKMKKIIAVVKKSVESGNSLSDSLSRYPKVFSGIFISAVYAGESSGTLSNNLEHLAVQLQKEKELNSKVKGAMIYPIFILATTLILGVIISFVVLPKITPLFEGLKMDLPITTRALIAFSNFIIAHGFGLLISIILSVSLFLWIISLRLVRPVTHWISINIPVIKKIVINNNLARFTRTLGTLLKSGLTINEALSVTENSLNNYYFKKTIKTIAGRVSKGTSVAESLKGYEKYFPKMVSRMISVGEQSGSLENVLLYLADYYEIEVDNATKTLAVVIEPTLLLFIGGIVAVFALSIITPIYNITGNIKR